MAVYCKRQERKHNTTQSKTRTVLHSATRATCENWLSNVAKLNLVFSILRVTIIATDYLTLIFNFLINFSMKYLAALITLGVEIRVHVFLKTRGITASMLNLHLPCSPFKISLLLYLVGFSVKNFVLVVRGCFS